jgi:hypothetical protein
MKRDPTIEGLCDLALVGLRRMFRPERGLFCYREVWTAAGRSLLEGESFRYTAMSVIGLLAALRSGCAGAWKPAELNAIQETMHADRHAVTDLGDWGLLLWMLAAGDSGLATSVMAEIHAKLRGPDPAWDLREYGSMELAFLLAGVVEWREHNGDSESGRQAGGTVVRALLNLRHAGSGLFYGIPPRSGRLGGLRRRINSFAAQIYPVYALARYGGLWADAAALEAARACADRLIAQRAAGGGWCWQYDVPSGRVVETYPLYAVHQDGMAPMALQALAAVAGESYAGYAVDGMRWLKGENVLALDLVDRKKATIWRAIRRRGRGRLNSAILVNSALTVMGLRANRDVPTGFEPVAECRPYHLGWVLLAWS